MLEQIEVKPIKIRLDRLAKLADHLEKGQLGHVKFDFSLVHENGARLTTKQRKEGFCGTAGCAMGELPVLFPRKWKFADNDYGEPSVRMREGECPRIDIIYKSDVTEFFGISESKTAHLFYPGCQHHKWCSKSLNKMGGLSDKATRKQVAANIRYFIKNKGFEGDTGG